ncbi:hypothetical protein Sango_1506900 [Sesamum angolense]|uniref:CW-type domain-containing protein n=1 Tax=Sesamum angolense TaxID=2727404 RepID=A0AAE1WP42_9LAMI|nr:hypothetical protein Sango_1506900 [Sesamum angolense]
MCLVQTSAGAKPSDDSHSAISSAAPLVAAQERIVSFFERAKEAVAASFNRCSAGEEALVSDVDRVINACCANDNCSSSKSNLALSSVSLKIDMDDVGECSSSGALSEKVPDEMSERDICISMIRNQGLVDRVGSGQERDSSENTCIRNDIYYSQPCKISSEGELGSIEFMFTDTEPYMSNVRIGDEFQADVPDWSSPTYKERDPYVDWLEMDSSNNGSMQEQNYTKPLKLSSIGNWLQCQGLIEGIGEGGEGTICGKWRRAPLFEVQTDNWECFCCVLWDPSHADCAVPQELDTEEVMRQLKYIEMLRPQLAAKRRKLNFSK